VYLNKCPESTGGDDANMNPNLPAYNGGNSCDAVLSVNFCETIPGYCDDEYWLPEDYYTTTESTRRSALEARGESDTKSFTTVLTRHGTELRMIVIFLKDPPWRQWLATFVSENYYNYNSASCDYDGEGGLDPMEIFPLPTLGQADDPDYVLLWGLRNLAAQVEHVIDVSLSLCIKLLSQQIAEFSTETDHA
jgi:hypothetical protein